MKSSYSTHNADMPVPCRFWAEKLAAGHPDDLSLIERMALQTHLASCPSCSAVRAEYEAIWQELRQLPVIEPRPGLPPALLELWQRQPQTDMSAESSTEHEAQTMPSLPSRRRRRPGLLVQTLTAALVIAALLGTSLALFAAYHSKVALTGANSGGWHIVKSPNIGKTENQLNAVSVAASNDIWAVGFFSNSPISNSSYAITGSRVLIEHWNGSTWSIVPGQNPGKVQNQLGAVAALSPDDAWAVGNFSDSRDSAFRPLLEHWNGRQWSLIADATKAAENAYLNDITAISASNIWAIGSYKNQVLIEHWNGSQWSIVPTPKTAGELDALAAITANDIWAAGASYNTTTYRPLIEHWNGSQWSIVPSPASGSSGLTAIAAASSNDVWAVGSSTTTIDRNSNTQQTLTEHWNGTQWSVVPSPNLSSAYNNYLSDVVAVSANDVWAVGSSPRSYPLLGPTLVEHWDGKTWHIVKGANLKQTNNNYLYAIARDPHTGTLWAVGANGSGYSNDSTLIEEYA